jgi:hypothetical protein
MISNIAEGNITRESKRCSINPLPVIGVPGSKLATQPIKSTRAVLCRLSDICDHKALLLCAVDTCKFCLQEGDGLKVCINYFIYTDIIKQ